MVWTYIIIGIIAMAAVVVLRKAQADPRNRARRKVGGSTY
jgi:hypothetical protein